MSECIEGKGAVNNALYNKFKDNELWNKYF